MALTVVSKPAVAYVNSPEIDPGRTETSLYDKPYVLSIKEAIIEEFGTSSPMMEVARCESHWQQFNSEGEVLKGRVNSKDVGIFQINERYHLDKSIELGLDIYTVEGNIKYAAYLYKTQGLQPWSASRPCWSQHVYEEESVIPNSSGTFLYNLNHIA